LVKIRIGNCNMEILQFHIEFKFKRA
jgi:hypothetical protein